MIGSNSTKTEIGHSHPIPILAIFFSEFEQSLPIRQQSNCRTIAYARYFSPAKPSPSFGGFTLLHMQFYLLSLFDYIKEIEGNPMMRFGKLMRIFLSAVVGLTTKMSARAKCMRL